MDLRKELHCLDMDMTFGKVIGTIQPSIFILGFDIFITVFMAKSISSWTYQIMVFVFFFFLFDISDDGI